MPEPITLWPTQVGVWNSRNMRVTIHRKECRHAHLGRSHAHETVLPTQRDIDEIVKESIPVDRCRCCANV